MEMLPVCSRKKYIYIMSNGIRMAYLICIIGGVNLNYLTFAVALRS